jgi:hypothetical protein
VHPYLALLRPAVADPDAITRLVDDDPPLAESPSALEAARRNGELEG